MGILFVMAGKNPEEGVLDQLPPIKGVKSGNKKKTMFYFVKADDGVKNSPATTATTATFATTEEKKTKPIP